MVLVSERMVSLYEGMGSASGLAVAQAILQISNSRLLHEVIIETPGDTIFEEPPVIVEEPDITTTIDEALTENVPKAEDDRSLVDLLNTANYGQLWTLLDRPRGEHGRLYEDRHTSAGELVVRRLIHYPVTDGIVGAGLWLEQQVGNSHAEMRKDARQLVHGDVEVGILRHHLKYLMHVDAGKDAPEAARRTLAAAVPIEDVSVE
jgi:hypothetical protein